MMLVAYKRFIDLIDDTKNVEVLYRYISNKVVVPIDTSDLLRWQWVQCVSAFDKLVHDLVKIGMIEIFNGTRETTAKYESFIIDLNTYQQMINNPDIACNIFEKRIILCNGYKAFQDPDKVADALSYIWDEKDKWIKISSNMRMHLNKDDCRTMLRNIVIRRNQIVHEGDYTDILLKRQDILDEDVESVRNFIIDLGKSIYNCVK